MANKDIRDANIPNVVNEEAIKEKLKNNHLVKQFADEGRKLLEKTERPNIITYAQFEPFIPLFNLDRKKYEDDQTYRLQMNRLYNQYTKGLGINLYQPTIVVVSEEDPTELYFLDRRFTRFKSDVVDGKSMRDNVPAAITRNASATRDQLLLDASIMDVMAANSTEEMKSYFARVKMDSALIQKNFVERNLSPEKKAEIMGETSPSDNREVGSSSSMEFFLVDDDDDD